MSSEQKELINVKEYRRLGDTGILHAINTVELIEGKIVDKSSPGYQKSLSLKAIVGLFTKQLADSCIVSIQEPLLLNSMSESSPDIKLLDYDNEFYANRNPKPKDVFLLIEICDSEIDREKKVKLPLYANVNIQELWIVNLLEERIEVYRSPSGKNYSQILLYKRGESIETLKFPGKSFAVDEILGPKDPLQEKSK
ncbi:MAG: Uma2 family endonuclease [Spirochaetota bacterium]